MLTEKVKSLLKEINKIDKKRMRLRWQRERLQLKVNELENEQAKGLTLDKKSDKVQT